jgi:hypothetical protein
MTQENPMNKEMFNPVWQSISSYLVGIVKLRKTDSFDKVTLCGSGTLAEINGRHAILTAHHVIEALPNSGEIGLILAPQPAHKFTLNVETLNKVKLARGWSESEGPDLGLILLPMERLGQIKALQSFYNLSKRREKMLSDPPEITRGVWLLCGYPDEWAKDQEAEGGFAQVTGFKALCYGGGVDNECIREGFDYLDFHVDSGQLQSFGGVSGGGLWHVLLKKSLEGKLEVSDSIFSGVAFYESPLVDGSRSIRCHGRQSIYKNVYASVP